MKLSARAHGDPGCESSTLFSSRSLGSVESSDVKTRHWRIICTSAPGSSPTSPKLQTLGLVQKTTDAADRRRTVLTVTRKGRDSLAEEAPFQRQVNDVEFALTADDFRQFSRIVSALVDSSEQAVNLQRYLEGAGKKAKQRRRPASEFRYALFMTTDSHVRPIRFRRVEPALQATSL